MPLVDEILGADFTEHNIRHDGYNYEEMVEGFEKMGYHIHQPWCKEVNPWILVNFRTLVGFE